MIKVREILVESTTPSFCWNCTFNKITFLDLNTMWREGFQLLYKGYEPFYFELSPLSHDDIETLTDVQLAQKDVVHALVKMDLLPRLRYILEVIRLPVLVDEIVDILLCIASHSDILVSHIVEVTLLDVVTKSSVLDF